MDTTKSMFDDYIEDEEIVDEEDEEFEGLTDEELNDLEDEL